MLAPGCKGGDKDAAPSDDSDTATGSTGAASGEATDTPGSDTSAGPTSGDTSVDDDSGSDSSGSSGSTGSSGDTGEVPAEDRIVLRTGEFVGDGEVGRIEAWGIADDPFVNAKISWVQDGAEQGSSLIRWHEADDTVEVLASPTQLMAATGGTTLGTTLFDAAGFNAFEDAMGCTGMWDGMLLAQLCADDPALAPGAMFSLLGLANGTSMVYAFRNGGMSPSFELFGVDPIVPRVRYAYDGSSVDHDIWTDVRTIRSAAIASNAGVAVNAGGLTLVADSAGGVLSSDGLPGPVMRSYVHTGSMPGGFFPGGVWDDNLLLNQGQVYRGVTLNEEGVYAFAFVATDQTGALDPNAGIYSFAPGEDEFTRHYDFNEPIFDGFELSPIVTEGTTPAFPAVAFGLTSNRQIVMLASLENGSTGVWREKEAGAGALSVPLASVGLMAHDDRGLFLEDTTYANFGSLVMADDGGLMFTARIEGPGIEGAFGLGVWGVGPSLEDPEVPRLLARFGDPLPGGDGEITRIQIADGIVLPDVQLADGLGRRTINNVTTDLQVFGSSGSSQVIRPSACGRGLVHVSDGDEDVLMLMTLDPGCL